jgi:hypothetical protein
MKIVRKIYRVRRMKMRMNIEKIEKNIKDMLDHMIMEDYNERFQQVFQPKYYL